MDSDDINKTKKVPQSSYSVYIALEKYISPNVWKRLNRKDLACDSRDLVSIEEYVQPLFTNNPFDMRRYGTAKELTVNINLFCGIPGAHKVFGDDPCNFYFTYPICYFNAKKEMFLHKQDTFQCLQTFCCDKFALRKPSDTIVSAILAAYLKPHKAKHESVCEFVRVDEFNESFSNGMVEELTRKLEKPRRERSETPMTINGVLERIKEIVPEWNEKDYDQSVKIVHEMWDELSEELQNTVHVNFLDLIENVIKSINFIISRSPHLYLPIKYTPGSTETRYVRLFENGYQKFVMTDELNRVASVPGNKMSTRYLTTVDEQTALELIRTRAHYSGTPVEFIVVPIIRVQHSALLIRTPNKGHCKLAIDLFMELLQDLIFGVKIFQKLNNSEWPVIEQFFKKLQHHFNPEEKEPYFIRLADYEKDEIMRLNYFDEYDSRPTKNNRNAKADGFTAQNLRNELVYLGFEEMFPDITKIADQVHEDVVREKNGQILQTSDLFAAVGRCVTYFLLKKLPDMKEFARNQNAIKLPLQCAPDDLPKSSNKRFNDTKWKWIDIADIDVKNTNGSGEKLARVNKKLILPGGKELYYNDSGFAAAAFKICAHCPEKLQNFLPVNEKDYDYVFLMDSEEVDWLSSENGGTIDERLNYASAACQTTQSVVTHFPNKVPYLRTLWLSPINRKEQGLFFLNEVYEVILVALLQQQGNKPYDEEGLINDELWMKYKETHVPKMTLNMKELKEALEWFDVDKSQITLVPDIAYASSVLHQMPLNTGCPTIEVIGPCREELFDRSQAVFKIFQEVVCDIDWSKNIPGANDPTNSIYAFQSEILAEMRMVTEKGLFVWVGGVEECVQILKTKKHYLKCKKKLLLTPLIKLFDCDINDSISIAFFLSECEKYGIPYQAPPVMNKKTLCNTYLHIWKARLLFLYEWNKMFFDFQSNLRSEYGDIEDLIKSGIYHRAPLINWESEADFMKLIVGVDRKQQENVKELQLTSAGYLYKPRNHEWLENTSWRDRTYIKRTRKKEVVELAEKLKSFPTLEGFVRIEQEKKKLLGEALNDQFIVNERNVIHMMSKILDYSESIKKTAEHIVNDSEKSAVQPEPSQSSNLPEIPKNEGSAVDMNSQKQNEGNDTETTRNGEGMMQQSSECVAEPEKVQISPKVASTVSADSFDAQRKEMDEMKQMIKTLQEEVLGNKQPAPKTVPLETHQKEVKELQLKIDYFHEKFQRTSDLCNERTAELKSATQKLEKLKKQESSAEKTLKEIREKEKGKPTREQLEKELEKARKRAEELEKEKMKEQDEFQKKVEKMEKEKVEQGKAQEQLAETIRKLTQELESQRLTSASEAEQMSVRTAELESFYSESQERIQFFKRQFPKEILDGFNFRPSLEMRKALGKLRTDQETLQSGKHCDIALKKVLKLEKMTDSAKVHDLASYYLTDYNGKLTEFENMISENIRRIQSNPLITQAELLPHLEFPKLNDYIEKETTKAQQAINEKIERECMCCYSEKDRKGGWWRCSGCLKKCHQVCLDKSVEYGRLRICPLCRCAI